MAEDKTPDARLLAELAQANERLEREVEERRRAEASLQEAVAQLKQLESIVNHSSAVVFRWRVVEGWPLEYISENVSQFGYTAEELLSRHVELSELFHPEDEPRLRSEVISHFTAGRTAFGQEYRVVARSGEVRYVEDWNLVITDPRGKPTHVQGIALDVTDRKQAEDALRANEERYRALLNGVPDMIFHLGSDGTFLDFSPGRDLSPYVPPSEFLGKTMTEVLPAGLADPFMRRMARAIETGKTQTYEYHLEQEGQQRDYEVRIVRGNRDEVFAIVRENTEKNRTQLALQRTLRLASVGTLAAGIAHEINNPIAAVLTAAETAISVCDDPQATQMVKECLENVITSGTRCAGIVRNVLKFARHEPTDKALHSLDQVLEHALKHARAFLVPDTITLVVDEHLETIQVLVNPLEIEQVMANLIQNAVRAADGQGIVQVSTERTPTSVKFKVRDNGRGMTEEEKAHIFDPFFTTRQREGGTGLGLSIAYSIVEDHGGSIEIDSHLGRGTIVAVELPLPEGDVENAP